ncbi:MAG TPA: phenylacetate-CoA oxygenase/reductase subunit PaaK [Saprospiraceae bacterium]|nr:phenylacetate-CoA oxygenase/reductase subunit PaaK [Saprospiraceae bacterium]HMQ82226.1 phenylacetate-CoA oxygenase/reductase subunit PaaK [Saprospiraceae bacterium]
MPKFHPLTVKEIRFETKDCVSLAFEIPEALKADYSFVPGQYLTLKKEINGLSERRSYSICSGLNDQELRVAVKKIDGGAFSGFIHEQLKAGDTLAVMTPMGRFLLPDSNGQQAHYVAFAAGSGITPILAMMKATLERDDTSFFTLFYGNRSTDSIIFREVIEGLKNKYMTRLRVHHVLSREKLGIPLFFGRIDAEKCRDFCSKLFDPASVDAYFLCGPEQMIQEAKSVLLEEGVPTHRIHFELFGAPIVPSQEKQEEKKLLREQVESEVSVILDGDTFHFSLSSRGETILEAALKAGADLPFSCKGGVCCTCRAKLLEGEAAMDLNYALEPAEVEAGFILTCQAHPLSDHVVVDFDV